MSKVFKYELHKTNKDGTTEVIAASDWSNILFSYIKAHIKPANAANYVVINTSTGLPAGQVAQKPKTETKVAAKPTVNRKVVRAVSDRRKVAALRK